jgi:hypothetical protein
MSLSFWDKWYCNLVSEQMYWVRTLSSSFTSHFNSIFQILGLTYYYYFMTRNPSKTGHFVYPPLLGKSRICVKRPLHTDRIILRLRSQAGPKKLFASKGIRTLDFIGLPQRPMPLPLELHLLRKSLSHMRVIKY